ncbi:MAG: hypothetical protein OJF49_001598 [Ktedonobacterales bacterium]|jgi:hypothetical protein|nr:MAG: hypothetical protein OJF49_001598 [Ktedonobacterales bacterium]
MSEFERFEASSAWTDAEDSFSFPSDFSEEDAAFANDLRELFSPEQEELPPYYAQTLLEHERHAIAEKWFELKLIYKVFRRLRLRRTLLPLATEPQRLGHLWPAAKSRLAHMNRRVTTSFAAALAFMVLTVLVASPSFAAGMRILLGRTGVIQVQSYPTHIASSGTPKHQHTQDLLTFDPAMQLSWLGRSFGDYTYRGVQLDVPTSWSNGPIVEMQYQLANHTGGTGVVDIREFRVNASCAAVYQVVQTGSTTPVQFGSTQAVYVDGTWVPRGLRRPAMTSSFDGMAPYSWEPGTRSMLIFQQNDVVFWMVGDQRSGIGQNELVRLAESLSPTTPSQLTPSATALRLAGNSLETSLKLPQGWELYWVVPNGAASGSGTGAFQASGQ